MYRLEVIEEDKEAGRRNWIKQKEGWKRREMENMKNLYNCP